MQDKWEDNTYVVVDQPAKNTPVFTVQREEGGRLKTLHRNILFLLSQELHCSQKVEVSNSDVEDNCEDILDSSDHETDHDEKQEYVGPVTRSEQELKIKQIC